MRGAGTSARPAPEREGRSRAGVSICRLRYLGDCVLEGFALVVVDVASIEDAL